VAKVGQLSVDLEVSVAKFKKDLEQAKARLDTFSAKGRKSLGTLQRGFKGVGKSLMSFKGLIAGAAFGAGIKSVSEFGAKMSEVAAVSRATGSQLDAMREQAKELGATTKFSASEAAGGMAFLARAGFDANQTMAALPATLDLAAAGGLGLAEAADIASNIMQGFGANANEAGRFADVLAETAANSNTNIQQLGEAMKLAAPVANSLGVGVEEASAAVGVLSNAGLQASMAGTGLRRVLTSLANPSAELKQLMGGLSVESDGLTKVMQHLKEQNLTTGQAMELFGDRGGTAFLVMEEGIDTMVDLNGKLDASSGAAKQMADTMNDNLAGSFKQMMSAAENLAIELGDAGLTAILRGVIDAITFLIRKLSELVIYIKDTVLDIVDGLAIAFIHLQDALGLIDDDVAAEALKEFNDRAKETTKSVQALNTELGKTVNGDLLTGAGSGGGSGGGRSTVEKMTDLQKEAQRVIEQTRTKTEKYNTELAKLNNLLKEGAIDQETYNRAVEQAKERYGEAADEMSNLDKVTDDLLSGQIDSWDDLKNVAVNALQEIIKNLIKTNQTASRTGNVLGGLNTGFGSSGGSIFDTILSFGASLFSSFHSGGVVGSGGGSRRVNPGVFAGAPRFHSGGLVGDEVPIIAKKKEMVLTEAQQRMMMNSGGGSMIVNIHNNNGSAVSATQTRNGNEVTLDVQLDQAMAKNITTSGSKTYQALDAFNSRSIVRR
jgi:TP901 family phage tail tape measure protein